MFVNLIQFKKTIWCAVLILIISIWLFNIGQVRLIEPDEGRYAEVPREMLTSSNFVTPTINGIRYLEKPPLQYWATALTFKYFGESEITARIWPAITALLMLFSVFIFTFLNFNILTALTASGILISSPLFIILGHLNTLDMGFTFFLTLIMLSSTYLIRPNLNSKQKIYSNIIFWSAGALGVLSKGIAAIILPAMVLGVYFLFTREIQFFKNTMWIYGTLLFLLIAAPWFILMHKHNPDFLRFFFIHEHFERYLTKSHDREGPWWYFLPILLSGFFPWVFYFLFISLVKIKKIFFKPLDHKSRNIYFFLIWSITIFLFFSISTSKLPPYILPIIPALAIVVAVWLQETEFYKFTTNISNALLFSLPVIGAITYFKLHTFYTKHVSTEYFQVFAKYALIASGISLFALMTYYHFQYHYFRHLKDLATKINFKIIALSISALLFFQILIWGYGSLSVAYSGYHLSQIIKAETQPDTPIYSVGNYVNGLSFYLKRFVTLVDYDGELRYGLDTELPPEQNLHWIKDVTEFEIKWRSLSSGIAVLSTTHFAQFTRNKLPMRVLYQDSRRIAVAR
jgi:4-amino-4-deoxy-L-arabinose transferase-like glycosyltransferase